MKQLTQLAKPFSNHLVHKKPEGFGNYVEHGVYNQRLLGTIGPFDMELVQEIRGRADEVVGEKKTYPAVENAIVGAWFRFTFHIDGRTVSITEAGDVEKPAMKETDGARAKDAVSDALKRACMRIGLGLHLWKGEYILSDVLQRSEGEVAESEQSEPKATSEEGSGPGAVASPPSNSGSGESGGVPRVWGSTRDAGSSTSTQPSLGGGAEPPSPSIQSVPPSEHLDGITPGDIALVASKAGNKRDDKIAAIQQKFQVPRDIAMQWLQTSERLAKK